MPEASFTVDDAAWKAMLERLDGLEELRVRVGVLSSKGGGAKHPSGDITILHLAAIHEFGSPAANIPERSFIRRTFWTSGVWLPAFQARLAKGIITGKLTAALALEILGQKCVGEVQKTIKGGEPIPPPLRPATIARKGSSRPLVDTGRLVQSIAYEVTRGGGAGVKTSIRGPG